MRPTWHGVSKQFVDRRAAEPPEPVRRTLKPDADTRTLPYSQLTGAGRRVHLGRHDATIHFPRFNSHSFFIHHSRQAEAGDNVGGITARNWNRIVTLPPPWFRCRFEAKLIAHCSRLCEAHCDAVISGCEMNAILRGVQTRET